MKYVFALKGVFITLNGPFHTVNIFMQTLHSSVVGSLFLDRTLLFLKISAKEYEAPALLRRRIYQIMVPKGEDLEC